MAGVAEMNHISQLAQLGHLMAISDNGMLP